MKHKAFTLTEVIIASTVFSVLVALVMASVVSQSKFGISIGNYADMNAYSRRVLTQFEKEMRMATTVKSMSDSEVIVSIIDDLDWSKLGTPVDAVSGKSKDVRYFYSAADKKFYRQYPAGASGSAKDANCTSLLNDLSACHLAYFNTDDLVVAPGSIGDIGSVKKVLLSGTMQRSFTGTKNTDYLVSAIVVMRSKNGTRQGAGS